jgi:hypothetical protein
MKPTLEELLTQQAEVNKALAEHEKPLIEEAIATVESESVAGVVSALQTISSQLPEGGAKTHIGNLLIVLNNAPGLLRMELMRVSAAIAPPVISPFVAYPIPPTGVQPESAN